MLSSFNSQLHLEPVSWKTNLLNQTSYLQPTIDHESDKVFSTTDKYHVQDFPNHYITIIAAIYFIPNLISDFPQAMSLHLFYPYEPHIKLFHRNCISYLFSHVTCLFSTESSACTLNQSKTNISKPHLTISG